MSHYRVLVISPSEAEEDDAEGYVEDLLALYDENLTVDPCWAECGCRRQRTWQRLADAAAHERGFADWDAWREAMRAEAPTQDPDVLYLDDVPAFRAIIQSIDIQAADQASETPPDPGCPTCHGRGRYRTTYNPGARWDWWVIGGRWDDPVGNIRRLQDCPADDPPIAVVTPDGTWHEQAEVGWFGIFCSERGTLLWPANVNRRFRALRHQAGLPDTVRIHDSRHAMATLWLSQGVPVKVVSERLGHANVSITLQIYGHLLPHMQAEAAAAMEAHLVDVIPIIPTNVEKWVIR